MICVNELASQKCRSRQVLSQLLLLLAPFAPHVSEELWHKAIGSDTSIFNASWPEYNEEYLKENTVTMGVSFNGKPRFNITVAAGTSNADIEAAAMTDPAAAKWLEGKTVRKVIVVPGKIVNIVVG